jgi:hypothetical protein
MGRTKHQHTVPRTYLEKFSHRADRDTYFVDCLDKEKLEIKEDLSCSNICVSKDYYTLKDVPEEEKLKIENFLSEYLEKEYNTVYNLLIDESVEFIDAQQRTSIIKTLLSLFFRTPKALNGFVEFASRLLENIKDSEIKKIDFLGQQIDLEHDDFREIKNQIREYHRIDFVKTQLQLFAHFCFLRGFDGIVVIKLAGEQEYLTSDNPVLIGDVNLQLHNLFSGANSIYVPIDPKHCVFIAPSFAGSIVNRIFRNEDNFMMHAIINHELLVKAEKWLIGTKFGIKKFRDEYEFYTRPANPNHPMILEMKMNLQIMMTLHQLTEEWLRTKDPTRLTTYLKMIKDSELFKKNPSFQKILRQHQGLGII